MGWNVSECICLWHLEIHSLRSALCTCGTLLELFIFLFPPLPRLEDTPQGGQLAVSSDGWSVDSGHQATGPQHPLLVHHLYYRVSGDGGGGQDAQRGAQSCYRRMKWGKEAARWVVSTGERSEKVRGSVEGWRKITRHANVGDEQETEGEGRRNTISTLTLLNKPWWTSSAVNRLN